jgi:mannose-6-phosphate isomerase-like protein (cupin superfamily)
MKFKIATLLSAEATQGLMAAFEETTTPGGGPPLHRHRDQLEVFHVIKGRHRFVVDGVETIAEPGACLVVPIGATHTFQNITTEEGILHFELLPAANSEDFFRRIAAGDFDPEKVAEFFDAYGIVLAGPPLA